MIMVMSLAVTTACTKAENEQPVTLTFVSTYDGKEAELMKARVKAFEQENPGIKVNFVEIAFGSANNYLKTAMLGDQSLDGFRSDNSWVPEFVELGLLQPIDNLISPEDANDFNPTALESVRIGGKLYGLPTVMEAPALLYNKRLLRENGYSEPPKTMDELMAMANKLTASGSYGLYVSNDSYFALPYIWAFGGETMTDDRKSHIASAESVQALAFMQQLRASGVTQPYPDFSDGYNRMMNDFKEGKSAMIVNGPWAVSDLLTGSEFQDAGNLGIAAVPAGPGGGQGSPSGGHSLVVSKYSKHPEETYKLLQYLSNVQTQTSQAKELKTLPSRLSVYEDSALASDAIVQGFKEVLDSAKPRPRISEGAEMFGDFTANLEQMLLGKLAPQEAAHNIDAAWRILLKLDR